MKKALVISFLLTTAFSGSVLAESVTLEVQGMTCSVCPITVTKALEKLNGVAEVDIDYKSKLAEIDYDPDLVSVHELIAATTNAGFPSSIFSNQSEQ